MVVGKLGFMGFFFYLNTLINPLIALNNLKTTQKLEIKNLYELRSGCIGNFKVKKKTLGTFFTKWNSFTPRSTILVARIDVNVGFLSLLPESNDLSLCSLKPRIKK
jgi:hypothetical protein